MPATWNWCEQNGAATGSPAHGTTSNESSAPPNDVSWKAVDDCRTASTGTAYSAAPIVAGQNSYTKYTYGQFSGTFNQILNCKFSPRVTPAGSLPSGIHLKGTVTNTYATPSQTANSALTTDVTSAPLAIGSGLTVLLGASPQAAASATLSSAGYTQYLPTQLQTDSNAAAGDLGSGAISLEISYDES